ncbi:MAG: hypothetical protein HOO06_09290 [Bdellovibrionaceae bacterium]|nr:hypothetical protein [Pseudobdellovibrionaceae bacterium]
MSNIDFSPEIQLEEKVQNAEGEIDRSVSPMIGLIAHPETSRQEELLKFDLEYQTEKPRGKKDSFVENGMLLLDSKEYKYSEVLFRKALLKDSKNFDAIVGLGLSFLGQLDFDKALKCFKASLQLKHTEKVLSYIGDCYYTKAEDEVALHYYEQSLIGLQYDSLRLFDIYKNIGNIFVRKNDYESAEENYNKAYTINPDSDVLAVNYGTLEIQKGNLDTAQERFKSAIHFNNKNDKAWLGLSLVNREFGDIDLSWGNLNKSLDLNPLNQVSLQLAMDWAFRDGKIDQMVGLLENYLSVNDQDAEMSFLQAQILYKIGRFAHAKIEMQRVLAIDPMLNGASDLMSFICESLNKVENRND